jgi:hypothetical protein
LCLDHVQPLKDRAELLLKMLAYGLFFLCRQVPEGVFERTKGLFARGVEELLAVPTRFPLVTQMLLHPLVDALAQFGWQVSVDNVLKAGRQVNFQGVMPGELIEDFDGQC